MEFEAAEIIDRRVAARIRERRIDVGVTLQSLGRQVGMTFQQIHKYEHGLSRITAGQLYKVARALNSPIDYFFTADDEAARGDNDAAFVLADAESASPPSDSGQYPTSCVGHRTRHLRPEQIDARRSPPRKAVDLTTDEYDLVPVIGTTSDPARRRGETALVEIECVGVVLRAMPGVDLQFLRDILQVVRDLGTRAETVPRSQDHEEGR